MSITATSETGTWSLLEFTIDMENSFVTAQIAFLSAQVLARKKSTARVLTSNLQKSSMFEIFPHFFDSHSTQTMINTKKRLYAQKRRVTSQALNDHQLRAIEDDTLSIIQRFCASVGPIGSKEWSKTHNVKERANNLVFDFMGTVCSGKSFGMLESTSNHCIMDVMSKGAQALNTELITSSSRIRSNVMGCILSAQTPAGNALFSTAELISEASLLITGGSDTTSTTLAATVFYLLHFSNTLAIAQSELRSTFNSADEIRAGSGLNGCVYLRACIYKSLRMSPPVGGLLAREVCEGDMHIDGEFVGEGTEVGTPIYALHHCEDCYPDLFQYKPERWLVDDEARVKMMESFMAFSMVPRRCVGKAMAMQELMTTLGRLLWLYEWRLKAGSRMGEAEGGSETSRERVNIKFEITLPIDVMVPN